MAALCASTAPAGRARSDPDTRRSSACVTLGTGRPSRRCRRLHGVIVGALEPRRIRASSASITPLAFDADVEACEQDASSIQRAASAACGQSMVAIELPSRVAARRLEIDSTAAAILVPRRRRSVRRSAAVGERSSAITSALLDVDVEALHAGPSHDHAELTSIGFHQVDDRPGSMAERVRHCALKVSMP